MDAARVSRMRPDRRGPARYAGGVVREVPAGSRAGGGDQVKRKRGKRENAERRPSAALGFVHGATVTAEFTLSVIRVLTDKAGPRIRPPVVAQRSGHHLERGRNELCRRFLDHPASPPWLLWVDTDMVFGPEQVRGIFEAAHPTAAPILGGLCFTDLVVPEVARVVRECAPEEIRKEDLSPVLDYPRNQLFRADVVGTGFLLVHRGVLERMAETYPEPEPWFTVTPHCKEEDLIFCLRARALGIPVSVDSRVRVGHVKPSVVSEDDYYPATASPEDLDGLVTARAMESLARREGLDVLREGLF